MLEIVYDAFGKPEYIVDESLSLTSGTFSASYLCRFGYKGYYIDPVSHFYRVGKRYYDAETGRFIAPDCAESLSPFAINGLNPFVYCLNNPVMGNLNKKENLSSSTLKSEDILTSFDHIISSSVTQLSIIDGLKYIVNIASNIQSLCDALNNIQLDIWYKHLKGNPPAKKEFNTLFKVGKAAKILKHYMRALSYMLIILENKNNPGELFWDIPYYIATSYLASSLGTFIGGVIGGPAGSAIGFIITIGLELIFAVFENEIRNFLSNGWHNLTHPASEWRPA